MADANSATEDTSIHSLLEKNMGEATDDAIVIEAGEEAAVETKPDKPREGDGKFAKVEKELPAPTIDTVITPDPNKPSAGEIVAATDPNAIYTQTPAAEVIHPPQSFTPEAKAMFANADPVLQKEMIKRDLDYSKGLQKNAESARFGDSVKPTFNKWLSYINARGATPAVAFETLMQAEYNLQTGSPQQKVQALHKIARDYNIDIGQPVTAQPENGQLDPDSWASQRIQQLEGRLNQYDLTQQQNADNEKAAQDTQMQQMIDEMSSNPAFPHFEILRPKMGQIMIAGMAESMEDAYKQAAWLNPDIRSSLMKVEEEKRIAEKARLAKEAKEKASSITGQQSGIEAPLKNVSIRDDLTQAITETGYRV